MAKLESEIKETIETYQVKFKDNKSVLEFETISKKFDDLVERGLIKKRGNNLLTTSELHIKNKLFFNINTK